VALAFADDLRRLPKVELHCHLVGALRLDTLVELAAKHRLALPHARDPLYRYRDFTDFIDTFRLASAVLREADDFARAAYEAVEDGARLGNLKHIEAFFNPGYFLGHGVAYRTQLDGLVAGFEAAQRDFGVSWLLIPSIDRQWPAEDAVAIVEQVVAERSRGRHGDRVAGIGLDGPEGEGPPQRFAAAYALAGRHGLKRTAHVCEDNQTLDRAPPSNVATCLDVLGCDRLDHGYNLMADDAMVRRARDSGIAFTVCGKTSVVRNRERRLASIRAMSEAGLRLVLTTDDPRMFGTDLGDTFVHVHESLGWDAAQAQRLCFAGIDAAWLDDAAKRSLRREFEREIAALDAP
jgi:adenosine deaminase